MTFSPGVATSQTRGLLFAISGTSLYVAREPRIAPPLVDILVDRDLYLGALDRTACFARLLADGEPPPPNTEAIQLRQLFGTLSDIEFGIATRALGFTAWDRDFKHCGRCGSLTNRSLTERARICTSCNFVSYPRLSPAVIVLVERDGKALLARNARTRMPFFSTLAGFVEVGESLEDCVSREIREEAGIELEDIRYFGSQPWPFTNSLMIGFTARWASGEIVPAPDEILDAGWFAPDELPPIPPKLSIARELIDDFVRRHPRS